MKESIFVTLQKCTVFEGFTPEEIREALSMVSYRMVELAARETYVLAGMPLHIPQELRIRSRGTERHSASN